MEKRLNISEISALFSAGRSCSQIVVEQWAEELGYDTEEAHRMAAAFGCGMFRGDTCGAVTGALVAIGLKYGYAAGDPDQKQILTGKVAEFQKMFTQKMGSTICRDLVGYDFSKAGEIERAAAAGRIREFCPKAVAAALEVLNEIM